MSVSVPVGIDFGTAVSVLGVARNRGIDIVVNEVSNRTTPALVGFGMKNRVVGESAKSQEISNIKNTVGQLKRLVGHEGSDPSIEVEQQFNGAKLEAVDGEAGCAVRYLGKQAHFTFTQLTATYFNKLRQILLNDTKGNIYDVVITVPAYLSDKQRRAVADAAVIAGLNPVRIVNDTTAAAVGYGVFRTDLPEASEPARTVAIVDIGYSDYTVSVVDFRKGEAKVRGTSTDSTFGGRNIDLAIVNHLRKVFMDKYKIDIATNPKAWARTLVQAERTKKILSANSTAQFSVESLMEDIDVSTSISREELEEYLKPVLANLHKPIEGALKQAGVTIDDLHSVEIIGGTTRVPSIKDALVEAFKGKTLSTTMNADEAVARGATFLCASHSPTVRVRPFKIEDINLRSVTFSWEKLPEEDLSELEVFPVGSPFPSTKVVTLFRSKDFSLKARYTHPKDLPAGVNAEVGSWDIKGVAPAASGDSVAVKIKLRQDPSGLYIVESAYAAEEVEVEEEIPAKDEDAEPETRKVKKWVKKADLEVVHHASGLSQQQIDQLTEKENQMSAEDKLVADTEERKNALEEYIYDIRDKLDGQYKEFVKPDEKTRICELCDAAESWLYGDGEDASKGQYVAKYEEIASIGNLVKGRYTSKLEEERQAKVAAKEAEQQRKMAEKLQADKAAREAAAAKGEQPDAKDGADEANDIEMD